MAKQIKKYKYRSAITGKLVTKSYALQNPDTTVKELVKSKK